VTQEKPIRSILVDDEPWARRRLRTLLATEDDWRIVAECASAGEAVNAINRERPDVAFLDIRLGRTSGLDVLDAVPSESWPLVVFVTAYDQFAVYAFELEAVDYLVKPVEQGRFSQALTRVRRKLATVHDARQQMQHLLVSGGVADRTLKRIAVENRGRVQFVRPDDIDWVEAAGNYVILHVGNQTHLVRVAMNALESRLDPAVFVRVHRSTIINIDRVKTVQPWFRGEQALELSNGTRLTIGRAFRDRLKPIIANRC
jgi:two-component system LytT family response regulator